VTLKVWGELTFAEIAIALEIPANTAASRYRYGLEELRKHTKQGFM
jgi:RNA polymerase sigma-70 factor (ECF subfamily)